MMTAVPLRSGCLSQRNAGKKWLRLLKRLPPYSVTLRQKQGWINQFILMELDMAIYDEILEVLSFERGEALDADQVFELCKGIDDRNVVSSLLSYMYNKRKSIDREEFEYKGRLRYRYWKKPADQKPAEPVTTVHVDQIKQDAKQEFEIPEFLRKSSQEHLAKAYVAVPEAELQPEQQEPEMKPAKLVTQAVSQKVRIKMAIETLLASLPIDGTLTLCREGEGDNYRINLDLGAGDHEFNNLHPTDVVIALDAYATLQSLKTCK
jgi:hypothetical protein